MDEPREGGAGLPARRLSSEQLEAVIRRAVELQAAGGGTEGVSEAEAIRIGRELGLPDASLRQALAEVRGSPAAERGALVRLIGPAEVRVSRAVALGPERAATDLERYFAQCEHMTVQRRRPGWTVYEQSSSVAAAISRGMSGAKLINAPTVEVSVEAAEPGRSYVALGADLSSARAGFLTGAVLGGGGAGGAVAVSAGIAVAPPLALLGLPVLGAMWWAMRAGYENLTTRTLLRLESTLDRLESGELLPPPSGWRETLKVLKF